DIDGDRAGGEVKKWSADAALFCTALSVRNRERKVRVMGGAINKMALIPEGTPGTLTAVLNEHSNGATTGALTSTWTNAACGRNPFKARHNDFGTGDLEFECFSPGGTTDPLTITQAT